MNDVFGKQLGQYVLLEQLGEGGMARVYNAFDSRVERNVAIKVILASKRTSSVFLQQFEREAKALANLTHTNIVKVLNYGIQNGQPYLVMEYVSGGTLKEAMRQKLPWQTAAAILAPIARALDYVHEQQIVHRDVKPSNILLQDDFRPMLSDFGILKLLESKDEKPDSAIGAGIGTPEYMSPEQGMGKDVDFKADIYSLGLVFYEMVTGQKPYVADSPMAIVIKHLTDELPLPTRIDRNIPKFVERAILRAVQKDPRNRYISMGHFADVLELIALGDKAPSQKINRAAREREKRQRFLSIWSLSILLIALVIGTSFFGYNYFRGAYSGTGPLVTVTTNPTKTVTPTAAPTQVEASLPTTAPIATPESRSVPDLTLLGTPIVLDSTEPFTEIARWGIGGVNVVKWSPDGKTIALGTTSGIFFYDAQTKEQTLFIDTQFNVLEMSFNRTGDEIAAGSHAGAVQVWNTRDGLSLRTYSYTRPTSETITNDRTVTTITYSLDGKYVAIGFANGAINYYPSDEAVLIWAFENYPTVEDLVLSGDNRFIYATNGTRNIIVWDIQYQTKTELINPTPIDGLKLSSDQQFLLAGGTGSIYLWDFVDSLNVSSFPNLGGRPTDFDFSHDGKSVVIALNTGDIKVFAIPAAADYSKTHVPQLAFKAYGDQILSLASAPDQPMIATGNLEEGLKVWDTRNGENLFSLNQSRLAIQALNFSDDGLWLASAYLDGMVRLWDVMAATEAYPPFEGYLPGGHPFSPDSRFLAYIYSPGGNKPEVIRVMELESGKTIAELTAPIIIQKGFVQFSSDTKLLVMGDAYQARIWDVATWEEVYVHGGPNAGCGQYFTPDPENELLAVISRVGIMFSYDSKAQELCAKKPRGAIMMFYFYAQHKIGLVLESGAFTILSLQSVELNRIDSETSYPLPGEIFLAGDQASGWYAFVENGIMNIENVNGTSGTLISTQDDYKFRVALLPDKKLMALGSRYGSIHLWAMP
jgi:serine/threonine protein kinase